MFNRKRWIPRLMLLIFLSLGFVTLYATQPLPLVDYTPEPTLFGDDVYQSNRYTQADDQRVILIDSTIPDGFQFVATNELLALYFDPNDPRLIIHDLQSGYLWKTYAPVPSSGVSQTSRRLLKSLVYLEYFQYIEETARLSTSTKRLNSNDASISYAFLSDGLNIQFDFTVVQISFLMEIRLVGSDILVQIPNQSIQEGTHRIASISLLPQLGSTRGDEIPGYIVIPDGPGALYRFKDSPITEPVQFSSRFYGNDLGIKLESTSNSQTNLSLPIFGMVHGVEQQGFLGIIESGDAMAQYTLIPSGANGLDYNSNYIQFIMRETFVFPTNNKGDGITTVPNERFLSNMSIRYRFVRSEQATYLGLAKSYQQYLQEKEVLRPIMSPDFRVRLEILLSDSEPGMFGMTPFTMTTVDQAKDLILELYNQQVFPHIVLRGWNPGGMSGQTPYATRFNPGVGSKQEFLDFSNEMRQLGLTTALYADYVRAYSSIRRSKQQIEYARGIYRRPLVFSNPSLLYPEAFYLDPISTMNLILTDQSFFSDAGYSVAHDRIGYSLFSTYYEGQWWNREASIAAYQTALQGNIPSNHSYQPNAYLWSFLDSYYDVPLFASQFQFYDDTIPFLPYVLRNTMNLYSPLMNFFANPSEQILRMIDYGLWPSYLVTHQPTTRLRYSQANQFYTTSFSHWSPKIQTSFRILEDLHRQIGDQAIESRHVPQIGVVVIAYANGSRLYINYTDSLVEVSGIQVSAKAFHLEVIQ